MEKRYQVFVSSTYSDLLDERQEVIQALLELDCIPSGMELFPAADQDQWSLIKNVIDDCDYYIIILAGRYGTMGPENYSYTEMEYRYALERKKPIIGFCHKNISALPISKGEQSDQGKKRLETFRDLVKNKPCRFWETSAELGSQVSRSLIKLIKTNPSVGWVRGDSIPDHSTMEEILKLRRRIEELELELVNNKSAQPSGSGDLAQGAELYNVTLNFKGKETKSPWTEYNCIWHLDISWDEIFGCVSPLMIDEANEREMRYAISKFLQLKSEKDIQKHKDLKLLSLSSFIVSDADFHTIKIQLRALGLITKSTKSRSVKDTLTYWTLTAYGDDVMTKLRAIKKAQDEN